MSNSSILWGADQPTITQAAKNDADAKGYTFQEGERSIACPAGTYKVALVLDPVELGDYYISYTDGTVSQYGWDYHWYRQDSDGYWSHKPGHSEVTNVDAGGKRIWDPQTADRHAIGGPNYSKFGGYLCVAPAQK